VAQESIKDHSKEVLGACGWGQDAFNGHMTPNMCAVLMENATHEEPAMPIMSLTRQLNGLLAEDFLMDEETPQAVHYQLHLAEHIIVLPFLARSLDIRKL
jgi:hypothetical protein